MVSLIEKEGVERKGRENFLFWPFSRVRVK